MKKLIAPLLGLLAIGCAQPTVISTGADNDSFRIAAWNVEHLAAEPGLGCEPRDEEGYRLVATVIERVDADIWLLQEIENEQSLARIFNPAEWTFHVEQRSDTGTGPFCRGRDDGTRLRMQRTAIVVRDGIDHTRGADLTMLDVDGRGFLRHGVTVTVNRSSGPLDLMSVHLKSGCFSDDGTDDFPILFEQMPILESWIDERSAQGRAALIGGDFNRRLAEDGDVIWADLNDGDPASLAIAGEGIGPECDPRYTQFIDFLVMNELAESASESGSFREISFSEGALVSDHCPISVNLR